MFTNTPPWLRFIEGADNEAGAATAEDNAETSSDATEKTTAEGGEETSPGEEEEEENPDGRGSKRAVLGDLAKERDKRQAAEAERDELKKQLDAIAEKDMTELEKAQKHQAELQSRVEELEKEKADAERKRMIAGALKKAGLPAEMEGRLQGETAEELEADAKKLAEVLGYDRRAVDPSQARTNKGAIAASLSEALRNHYNPH